MASEFKINRQAIRRMTQDLEREFAKHPVRVPLEMDPRQVTAPSPTINNYHGPVVTVTGDHAQVAWGNESVEQGQRTEQVAPGFERLASLLASVLAATGSLGLPEADASALQSSAEELLSEVTQAEPDSGRVARGVTAIKGLLAPVALGLAQAVTAESAELARSMIDGLGNALPL